MAGRCCAENCRKVFAKTKTNAPVPARRTWRCALTILSQWLLGARAAWLALHFSSLISIGGARSSGNANVSGAPSKEWTYGLYTYVNGRFLQRNVAYALSIQGVFTSIPLTSVHAESHVLNYGAEVVFTQTYKNVGASPLDATYVAENNMRSLLSRSYVFPVPFQGTITNFEASI